MINMLIEAERLQPFLEFKKHLFVGPEKKRNTVCKNALIIALDDLWPHIKVDMWTFSYKKQFLNLL